MTPDLPTRVREAARERSWTLMVCKRSGALTHECPSPDNACEYACAEEEVEVMRLDALAAVVAVVQEDRTRATLAILDGLAECSIDEWGEGYAAALNDVRFNVIHEFGGTTHD